MVTERDIHFVFSFTSKGTVEYEDKLQVESNLNNENKKTMFCINQMKVYLNLYSHVLCNTECTIIFQLSFFKSNEKNKSLIFKDPELVFFSFKTLGSEFTLGM